MSSLYTEKIPTYEFKIEKNDSTRFFTYEPATSMYKNKVQDLWKNYDPYPEMATGDTQEIYKLNEIVITQLKLLGIFKIILHKKVFDTSFDTNVIDFPPLTILSLNTQKIARDQYFLKLKKINPYIGIFWYEINGKIQELDWLATPARKIAAISNTGFGSQNYNDEFESFSTDIFHINDEAWLVIFHHKNNEVTIYQTINICRSGLFYDDFEGFSSQKLLEVLSILPNDKMYSVISAWDLFFVNRYKYFIGEHPYIDPLDPEEFSIQDKTRMFLIWLHRLQEFTTKLFQFHREGKTIILTKKHNELNGEYVSYNITYTPEIRREIISKKDNFQLYAIANDWFVN